MTVYSPIKGTAIPIASSPDPVFAAKILGDGIVVAPLGTENQVIVQSPIDGTVKTLNKSNHAVVLESDTGVELLVHVGVDTVVLKGKGFKAFVKEGERIVRGDKLIKVDLKFVRANAPSEVIAILVTNRPDDAIGSPIEGAVNVGTPLFTIPDRAKPAAPR